MCWYKEGPGAVGSPEKGGFIPSAKTGGKREDFKYGEYRQERMFGTEIADKSSDKKMDFMRALWGYARTDARPAFKEVERFGQIATMLPMLGARKILLRILLELAIKSESCLANSAIVGVKIFSPTVEPIKLQFNYGGKAYDLKAAIIEESALKTDEDPMNFHEVKILKAMSSANPSSVGCEPPRPFQTWLVPSLIESLNATTARAFWGVGLLPAVPSNPCLTVHHFPTRMSFS